ncbi:hypothetical protein [Flammeovirga sp. SJP92]|uniref:hypothetical protein n=1 Tax=Flammeovirga sp. SJP92 TaxID=1775430 RepID=UPI000786D1AE|nr:hypothetical protein [Flammeovirga sp. SJP92]KXX66703.1 hypothetical protein AVL50_31165 [Flammeovirga sp. SJP92]
MKQIFLSVVITIITANLYAQNDSIRGSYTIFESNATRNNRLILSADEDGAYFRSTWGTGGTDAFTFRNSNNEYIFTLDENNKIGIGTYTPNEKLTLQNGNIELAISNGYFFTSGEEINSIDFAYRDNRYTESKIAKISLKNYNPYGTGWYGFTERYNAGLSFYTSNDNSLIESMTIKHNGNIGIGTNLSSNPNNYKLAVNGTIGAKAIKVEVTTNTWSDFVFNDGYKLKSLKEVEEFIKLNNHLPDIPKADDVEKNGINLVEMDAKLLQKIEELTLYIIEQQKEIEELKEKNKKIKEIEEILEKNNLR